MSQKHACDEFNDLNYNENLWKVQRNYDIKLKNPINNNYNELYQINFKVCVLESLLWYLKFIN